VSSPRLKRVDASLRQVGWKEYGMACACDGKVSGTPDKKCAHCREAIAHGIPAPRHNCSYGNCS
jgi:hypothetical protein